MLEIICENNLEDKVNQLLSENEQYMRSGCTLLDCALGGGVGLGVPFGKIINVVGDKSSGKTFLANELIAKNYHTQTNFFWNYDDCEMGHTFDTKKLYGFDIFKEDNIGSETIEELDVNLYNFIEKNKKGMGIYIIDSLDGLSNDEINKRELERVNYYNKDKTGKEFKEGTYGMKTPKFLSQEFFRTKVNKIDNQKIVLVFISQVRQNIDPMSFKKYTRNGGKALDFYCHTIVWLANIAKIKKNDKIIGLVVKAKIDKSKTPRPYRECVFSLYFDYGIDNTGSNLDFLFDLRGKDGILTKSANCIQYDGIPKNIKTYKVFLEENQLYEKSKDAKKADTGKSALSVEWLDGWIAKNEDLQKLVAEYFGKSYSRDELIARADTDKNFELEIEKKTVLKWEQIEDNLKTNRRCKYD